eukprot:418360-Amphidinium_carterae.2
MARCVQRDGHAVTCGDRGNHMWLKTVKEDPLQLVQEARAVNDEFASRVIAKCHCRTDTTIVIVVFLNGSSGQGDRQERRPHRWGTRLGKQESVVQESGLLRCCGHTMSTLGVCAQGHTSGNLLATTQISALCCQGQRTSKQAQGCLRRF